MPTPDRRQRPTDLVTPSESASRARRLGRVAGAATVAFGLVAATGLVATTVADTVTAGTKRPSRGAPAATVPATAPATDPTAVPAAVGDPTPTTPPQPAGSPAVRVVHRSKFRAAGRVTAPPKVRMRAWAIADMDTGVLLAVHHHRRWLPQASTIKLLTAVTAADRVPAMPQHRITRAEAHPQFCTCAGLRVGRRYSRAALLTGLLLPSGNDAAEALAGSDPHGHAAFIRAMNATARRLGATDTHAVTPSGLTAAGAHSSARDLLVLLRAAQANRVVAPFLHKASGPVGPLHGPSHVVYRATDYINIFPTAEGKSGYTTPALNTLVVETPMYTPAGRMHRIGVATLGSPSGYSTSGTRALTVWAAHNYDRLRPVGQLPPLPQNARGGHASPDPTRGVR
ncbi:MAG TPA: hypothetical protein VFN40_12340 [Gemmatimonadales bacterium]|nr:hypothetical protein [Gemmatimonadales bacterium]